MRIRFISVALKIERKYHKQRTMKNVFLKVSFFRAYAVKKITYGLLLVSILSPYTEIYTSEINSYSYVVFSIEEPVELLNNFKYCIKKRIFPRDFLHEIKKSQNKNSSSKI